MTKVERPYWTPVSAEKLGYRRNEWSKQWEVVYKVKMEDGTINYTTLESDGYATLYTDEPYAIEVTEKPAELNETPWGKRN